MQADVFFPANKKMETKLQRKRYKQWKFLDNREREREKAREKEKKSKRQWAVKR